MSNIQEMLNFIEEQGGEAKQIDVVSWYMEKFKCTPAGVYGVIATQLKKRVPTLKKVVYTTPEREKVIYLKRIK